MFFSTAAPASPPHFQATKVILEDLQPVDAGIKRRYPIDEASWLWHPHLRADQPAFVCFKLHFEVRSDEPALVLHFTADQRCELTLDGRRFAAGPEAAGIENYSFSTFRIEDLNTGEHTLEVFVWWLGGNSPLARETLAPGFVLAAEGAWAERCNTGIAAWTVCELPGLALEIERNFPPAFGIGKCLRFDARAFPWTDAQRDWHTPATVATPNTGTVFGVTRPRWRLRPARLPEMLYRPVRPGKVVAVSDTFVRANGWDEPLHAFSEEEAQHEAIPEIQEFWDNPLEHDLQIEPGQRLSVLVDLDDYYCGYPEVLTSGGRDAEIALDWSEGLIEAVDGMTKGREHQKGNRDVFIGKVFRGLNDTFICDGGEHRQMRPQWWRAGRYLLIRVRAHSEPLTLHRIQILETHYPYEFSDTFTCDQDPWIQPIRKIARRGLEMCSHETYMDCPFYEQLMYVFDTRLEVLTTYASTRDERLPRRAIEVFDTSRRRHAGAACSRFPSREDQLIPMFCLAWTWMLGDHLLWRDDPDWLRQFIPGARTTHDWFERFENADGLLENLPGWPYGDWVAGWKRGVPASAIDGISAIMNLLYVYSLRHLAWLETHLGDPARTAVWQAKADRLAAVVQQRYYDADRGLFADDDTRESWSQQAQIWAVLGGVVVGEAAGELLDRTLADASLWPASFFFRSLLFDALVQTDRGGQIIDQLGAWRAMVETGARTGFEHQEPTRSDCHAWSSHPLLHLPASIAGIRPAEPGFKSVNVRPQPGTLKQLSCALPHPRGDIHAEMQFASDTVKATIELPEGIPGTFHWRGQSTPLQPGHNDVRL
ncbi:MAG: alpha-L-rhamnosidase C-terminal domain-containing protein [Opitutales bacterium]